MTVIILLSTGFELMDAFEVDNYLIFFFNEYDYAEWITFGRWKRVARVGRVCVVS